VQANIEPLLVCYIPGLDQRLLSGDLTPNILAALDAYRPVDLKTIPTTELVPSIVTGVLPHEHRIWQVSLHPGFRDPAARKLADRLPDVVSTTIQCARHFFDHSYDLAAIPYWRRRRFDQHRFKYTRRMANPESLQEFGGHKTIFGLLGNQARYVFTKDFGELQNLASALPMSDHLLSFLEMYALDLVQHWHLDNAQVMGDALQRTDHFFGQLVEGCGRNGRRLVLLVDHGQEPVTGTIPLMQAVADADVSEREFTFFVELASARFWFHTDWAREAILARLQALPDTTVFNWQEMHEVGVCFETDAFGEYYVFADAGRIFFPHDFYQPIGNAVLGLMDRHQRQRVLNPVHRGNHGYLPHFPSERGWITAIDNTLTPSAEQGHITDVAPSLLHLVGHPAAAYMKGRCLFQLS